MGKGDDVTQTTRWAVPGVGHYSVDLISEVQLLSAQFAATLAGSSVSDQLKGMRTLIDRLEAAWLATAADFDQAAGTLDDGVVTLAAWMRHHCRIAPGEASSRAKVAAAITVGPLQTTGAAMKAGEISWRHAAVIQATTRDCPEAKRDEAEHALQQPAKELDPMLLRRVGAELLHRLDVDRAEAAAVRRLERRGLDVAETFDGMVAVNGLLDPLTGATLLSALDAKVSPTRGDDNDLRTWPQRRADALSEICREWMEFGNTPQVGGQKPQVSVLVDVATLRKESKCRPALLDWVGPITAEQARMIACDASVARVLTDGPSQILDVGRTTRTIPPAIRRAVVARDRECIANGCHRAPQHCDVHHIIFWANGGSTRLDNLVLLCRRHHGFVHERGWRVSQRPDGSMAFLGPSSKDPP